MFLSIGGRSVWPYKFMQKPSGAAIGRDRGLCYSVSSSTLAVVSTSGCCSHALPFLEGILEVSEGFGLSCWADAAFGRDDSFVSAQDAAPRLQRIGTVPQQSKDGHVKNKKTQFQCSRRCLLQCFVSRKRKWETL